MRVVPHGSRLRRSLVRDVETVARVLEFLEKYKFAGQITRRGRLFGKTEATVGPGDALRVLQTFLEDTHASYAGQVASASDWGTGSVDSKMRTSLGVDG